MAWHCRVVAVGFSKHKLPRGRGLFHGARKIYELVEFTVLTQKLVFYCVTM